MATVMQWIHVMAAVVGLGGIGFVLLILMPSLSNLDAEQRESVYRAIAGRFRWVSWSAMLLLLLSGLYNLRRYYWEEPWDRAWRFLTLKIVLAFGLFGIVLALTLPLPWFESLHRRRKRWLWIGFILGIVVVLISAYLRRA